MKIYEHKIISLLSQMSERDLETFFGNIPHKFAQQYENIIKKELGILFDEAQLANDQTKSIIISKCICKLESAVIMANLTDLMSKLIE